MTAPAAPMVKDLIGTDPNNQVVRARYMLRRNRGRKNLEKMKARYGEAFPGLNGSAEEWSNYSDWLWRTQDGPMDDRMFLSEKVRLFREGHQWVSSQNGRTFSNPKPPKNVIRSVVNMIGPANDYRLGILEEQRPGAQVEPHGRTSEDRDAAEAQRRFIEWLAHRRDMQARLQRAMRHGQDWGCAALQGIWNTELGVRKDASITVVDEQGNETIIPLDENGQRMPEGTPPHTYRDGDVDFLPIRGDQMRCDPEAFDVDDARYLQIRRLRLVSALVFEHGDKAREIKGQPWGDTVANTRGYLMPAVRQGEIVPDPDRFSDLPVIEETTTYLAPSDMIPEGMMVLTAGHTVLHVGPLPFGPFIPVARFSDGSTNPDFFPLPAAYDWLDDQIAINMLTSRIMQNARLNSGGRLLAYQGSVVRDTYSNNIGSVVEWKGAQPPTWLNSASVGEDTWNALQFHIQNIENKSGYTDVARGQVSSSMPESGRGILAIREQFERGMQPFVRAASRGMSATYKLGLRIAAWGYIQPRLTPIIGEDRPDLPRWITSADLARETDVYIDPATLMPEPRALKLQRAREELELQIIDVKEYRQIARTPGMTSALDRQRDRAKRINYMLEESADQIIQGAAMQPPVWWQDDPTTHQEILQEIILDDRKDPTLRQLASARWDYYALLQQAQLGDPNAAQSIKMVIEALAPGGPLQDPLTQQIQVQQQQQAAMPATPQDPLQITAGGSDPYANAAQIADGQTPGAAFDATQPQ